MRAREHTDTHARATCVRLAAASNVMCPAELLRGRTVTGRGLLGFTYGCMRWPGTGTKPQNNQSAVTGGKKDNLRRLQPASNLRG